jgi:hypothetical protein
MLYAEYDVANEAWGLSKLICQVGLERRIAF